MNYEDFAKEYNAIVERAFSLSMKARQEGILALEEGLDESKYIQREIFEYGVRLVVDGTSGEIINKILTNIIDQEPDKDRRLLKNIQKEAILSIQEGDNPMIMVILLSSYVNNELFAGTAKYLE
jgi:flagellar motor component MotA